MSAPSKETVPSTLRGGRYVVVGTLGIGSQGSTFDAVDKREGRAVAIKRFDVRGAKAWKDVELAERETRVLANLTHPRLPKYLEHFEEDGALYLVMEKIEGESLAAVRLRGALLDEAEVVRLLREGGEILSYLHGRASAVVHRDLKPGNVLRRPDGSFVFVDFGAVRDRMKPQGGSTVVGTFGYMPPEQFQGRAGPGADVYALAATALTMITGIEPENLPHKGLAIDVESVLRGRVSAPLVEVISSMLEPDPDRRPTSLGPLLTKLDRRTEDRGAKFRDASQPQRSTRRARREERRDERRARREKRRHRPRSAVPWLPALIAVLALSAVRLGLWILLCVALPTVLTILSLLFGKGLRSAARHVAESGKRAVDAIGRAGNAVQYGVAPRAEDEVRVRVVDHAREHAREDGRDKGPRGVGSAEDAEDAEADEDAEDWENEDESSHAGRTGRR